MTVSSSDLNTGSVGDKIVRTSDGAYICTASAGTTILPATDRAWNLPIGAKISVASLSPVKFTAEIREPVQTALDKRECWSLITTTNLSTPMATVLAGLDTWGDLVRGAPTT